VILQPGLTTPLNGHEPSILALLRERLSDKEIARKLSFFAVTVIRHAANLCRKPGVKRRWDAVIKAEVPGLLPPRCSFFIRRTVYTFFHPFGWYRSSGISATLTP
jgi:DNA-binding CsgD family transcriptional regulator